MTKSECAIDVQLLDRPVVLPAWEEFPQPAGAECIFIGRTRWEGDPRRGQLRQLLYDAYRPMAERVLLDLAQEAASRFCCLYVRVHHSVGIVPLGEASVLVQVVAGHREEAFAACRFLIDSLKSQAPIWKREEWDEGSSWSAGQPVPAGGDAR
jgi:molybdopterin synthase catalytic subunit